MAKGKRTKLGKNNGLQNTTQKCNWIWNEMSLKDFEMQIQFCKIICSVRYNKENVKNLVSIYMYIQM